MQLPVGADIEKTARCIIGAGADGISVGKELHSIDVRVVGGEGLSAALLSDIPDLCEGVTSSRNKHVVVDGIDAQAHDIAQVIGKIMNLGPGVNIPEHASHVARRSENTTVIDEATARKVTRMTRQFSGDTGWTLVGREIVDGADIVETTACDEVTAGRIGASHHPGRP